MSFDLFFFLRLLGVAFIVVLLFRYIKKRGGGSGASPTKHLDAFATNLTQRAKEGKIDPIVGREKEIKRLIQVITRRTKNNVILVGPAGVGKTAIVDGLALLIATGEVPSILKNKRVLSLQVSSLLAGTKYRGEFEERVERIVHDIKQAGRSIILFIDEIHTVIQTRGAEGSINLADMLKPALAAGDLQLIGATTKKEYENYIKPEESWDRRFQPIFVDEPTIAEAVEILKGVRKNYEKYHHVHLSDEALRSAVQLSEEYIKERQLPDKAIDLIDEASAMVTIEGSKKPHAHATGLLHSAAKILSDEKKRPDESSWPTVTTEHIKEIVAEWMDIAPADIH